MASDVTNRALHRRVSVREQERVYVMAFNISVNGIGLCTDTCEQERVCVMACEQERVYVIVYILG